MEKEPITPAGLKKIKKELHERISIIRPRIVKAISEARSHGDLKENAEYHAAKEEQGHNEQRIQEIETTIATANIVDVTKLKNDKKVIFGSTIIVKDLENDEEKKYKIVGKHEANAKEGLLFYKSPIALELVSKYEGDFVSVQTPAGEKNYEIIEVLYVEYYEEIK
jgi:transcription elongation factor GreA